MTDKQLTILLVDDNPNVTKLLADHLNDQPYSIKTAHTSHEVLQVFQTESINVLVTDIHLPKLKGMDICKQISKRYPETQIIVVSPHSDINIAIEAMKIGAIDFLQSPVDPQNLHLAINSSLEKWQLRHELRLAQQNLAAEKEFLSVTMRSIGDGVIATNLEGCITMINKVAEDLTGWTMREAVGKPLTDVFCIINEKTRKICENPVKKVLETGYIIGLANHTALIARDGTEKSIADSAAPIRDRNSKVIGTVLVFRDVTMENRINAELAKTKKLESVGILAGGIAHDFNNFLTGIIGNIAMGKILIGQEHKALAYLDAAEKASERASKLTNQLLTFSKGGNPIREAASIYELIKESSEFTLSGSSINCRIDRDSDLWVAEIDKGQISQVIQNLIINAKQAMPNGGTIHILCENYSKTEKTANHIPLSGGDYIKITFRDEGVGIHQEQLEQIFDPYFSTKQAGSGLGLAITHSIIKKHSGHITCESVPGNGTSFTIYLPASRKKLAAEIARDVIIKGSGRIMVMDDDDLVRNISQKILESAGYEVLLAKEGQEALDLYKKAYAGPQPIDLVIMDLTIPGGMGGREAMRKLLEFDHNAVAIVSSGYSNDPVMANYSEYGFKDVLDKPYEIVSFLNTVGKLLLAKSKDIPDTNSRIL